MKPASDTPTSTTKAMSWNNVIIESITKTHSAPSLYLNLRRPTKVAATDLLPNRKRFVVTWGT
jgi:hypothetical protein